MGLFEQVFEFRFPGFWEDVTSRLVELILRHRHPVVGDQSGSSICGLILDIELINDVIVFIEDFSINISQSSVYI